MHFDGYSLNILLTGRPGIGKTTVVIKLAELLGERKVAGFYTEEIREAGQRQGFQVRTLWGDVGVLSHVDIRSRHHVGRYGVDVDAFERLVLPELARKPDWFLIDEIGKMKCCSNAFQDAVRNALDGDTPVVATVAASGGGFIAEVKARDDVEIWEVTKANRVDLPSQLAHQVTART